MKLEGKWKEIRKVFKEAFKSSLHYSIATINEDGTPHITPIGSLILIEENKGIYFEIFTARIPKNVKSNQKVCVLAVNSSKWFWFLSLLRGEFLSPPAIRLTGIAGDRRKATEKEKQIWIRKVGLLRLLKGYSLLWGNLDYVREIHFDSFDPVLVGVMTKSLWPKD